MKKLFTQLSLACALLVPIAASAFVVGPTTPGKWGSPTMGTGATVTWSLMDTGTSCTGAGEAGACSVSSLQDFMPSAFLTHILNAFASWSAVANINFTQVPDDGAAFNTATSSGDIRIGGHAFDGPGSTLAHGFYPPINGGTAAGDIHFDTDEQWELAFGGPGFSIFQVMAHEIGHAIGLDHTSVANSLMDPLYTELFSGVQADDAAGAQHIYGARVSTPVSEPATLALLALALVGLAVRRKSAASKSS